VPSTPAVANSRKVPATPAPGDASDPEESEWDLNNPEHCVEVLENRFPFHEISQAGVTIDQFNKISRFCVDSLKRKVPKAPLSQHFLKDLEDITASKKNRMNWLTCWGKARKQQFLPKKPSK
jgi:hypothetical protein